jgi:hypothetical protein
MPFIDTHDSYVQSNSLALFSHLVELLKHGQHKRAWECGLPKGRYICDDGREILYDLDYCPWLQLRNGRIEPADRLEWVTNKRQEPFFYGSLWPYLQYQAMKNLRAVLLRWERHDTWWRKCDRRNAKIAKHQREKRRNRTHPARKNPAAKRGQGETYERT